MKQNPFWMTAKIEGRCRECESDINLSDRMVYDPELHKAFCDDCGTHLIGDDPRADSSKPEEVRKHVSSRAVSRSKETNKKKA